jgi:hypothetical protein
MGIYLLNYFGVFSFLEFAHNEYLLHVFYQPNPSSTLTTCFLTNIVNILDFVYFNNVNFYLLPQ